MTFPLTVQRFLSFFYFQLFGVLGVICLSDKSRVKYLSPPWWPLSSRQDFIQLASPRNCKTCQINYHCFQRQDLALNACTCTGLCMGIDVSVCESEWMCVSRKDLGNVHGGTSPHADWFRLCLKSVVPLNSFLINMTFIGSCSDIASSAKCALFSSFSATRQ